MAMVDVTVRGGGAFGLACAWECACRGAKVRLIELAKRVGSGASGGLEGALSPHVPENWNPKKQFQFESLVMAEPFWAAVNAAGGGNAGYARIGRIMPLQDDAAVARASERALGAARHWQGKAQWRIAKAAEFEGFAPRSGTGFVVHETLSARANPRGAGAALAAAYAAKGGETVFGDAPDEGEVIWATGVAGLRDLSEAFGRDIGGGVKGQCASLAYSADHLPLIYAENMYLVPHANGTVVIGATSERSFAAPDTTDDQLEALIARAREVCPSLTDAPVLERWAGVRPRAASRAPMLGPWPGRTGHYVANGGFKIGFGVAPKVAVVMADLVLEGRDDIPDGFRVEDSF